MGDRRSSSSSSSPPPPSPPSWRDLHKPTYYAAGTALFSLSNLCAQPFVLLKRRQQAGIAPPGIGGTFRALFAIARSEGPGGLFRSGRIAWIPGAARMGYFTAYEGVVDVLSNDAALRWPRRHRRRRDDDDRSFADEADEDDDGIRPPRAHPAWVSGAAGGASTLVSQLFMTPYSIVSGRLQIETGPTGTSALAVLRDVASGPGGARALWTGYLSAIAQLGPQHAAMWAVSGMLQDALIVVDRHPRREDDDESRPRTIDDGGGGGVRATPVEGEVVDVVGLGLLPRLATSACGSVVAIVVTSPVEVVRAHRQAMASNPSAALDLGFESATGRLGGTVPSSWAVFSRLYRREGASAFVRGIVPRAYANCPGMIAMMVGYQYVKELAVRVQRMAEKRD